jgi:hypothetical protein
MAVLFSLPVFFRVDLARDKRRVCKSSAPSVVRREFLCLTRGGGEECGCMHVRGPDPAAAARHRCTMCRAKGK